MSQSTGNLKERYQLNYTFWTFLRWNHFLELYCHTEKWDEWKKENPHELKLKGKDSFGIWRVKSLLCKEVTADLSSYSSGFRQGLVIALKWWTGNRVSQESRRVIRKMTSQARAGTSCAEHVLAEGNRIILVQVKFQTAELLKNTHLLIKLLSDLTGFARMEWMSFVIEVITICLYDVVIVVCLRLCFTDSVVLQSLPTLSIVDFVLKRLSRGRPRGLSAQRL